MAVKGINICDEYDTEQRQLWWRMDATHTCVMRFIDQRHSGILSRVIISDVDSLVRCTNIEKMEHL